MLGDKGVGKSTIIKQFRMMIKDLFCSEEISKFRKNILKNVYDDVKRLAQEMNESDSSLVSFNQVTSAAFIFLLREPFIDEYDATFEFCKNVKTLWSYEEVQNYCNEHGLCKNTKYFLNKLDDIINPKYILSCEDILHCYSMTQGVSETKVEENNRIKYHLMEVSTLSVFMELKRKMWIRLHEELDAIIFVVSPYQFCGGGQTSIDDVLCTLYKFRSIWNNAWLQSRTFILFLNKMDLFEEAIQSGKSKLAEYFPEFENFTIPPEGELETNKQDQGQDYEVIRAKYFIQSKFLQITEENADVIGRQNRHLYCVENTAVHRCERSKYVFEKIQDIIHRNQLCCSCTFGIM